MIRSSVLISMVAVWIALLLTAELCAKPAEASAVPMKPVIIEATAYCLTGFTFSGARVSHGVLAGGASFQIGQRIYIPDYGVGTVLDRGRLLYNQIDVWMASCYEARVWGRRKDITAWLLG